MPGFQGLEVGKQVDVWVPLEIEPRLRRPSWMTPSYNWLQLVGRLKPGVSFEQAQAELRVLFDKAVIENAVPLFRDSAWKAQARTWSLSLEPAGAGLSGTRRQFSKPLWVLMAIVAVLLLIACTNVANLLFVRALAREKEIAVRLSLGAGRGRLIRQLLTESAVLAAAGGAMGLFVAQFLSRRLAGFLATARSPLVLDVSPDPAILGFTAAVACCTVFLFGLIPAFRSTDMDFASRLKGAGPGWRSSKSHRWSAGLIVVQVALLMVLVLGAGLFLRTLHNLNSIDLGFDRSNVLLVSFDPFGSGHSPEQLKTLSARLLDRVKELPGVRTASLDMVSPIAGGGVTNSFEINRDGSAPSAARNVYVNRVGPEYFAALLTPIIAGRDFSRQDSATTPGVVIVNQTFANRYCGMTTCIGQTLTQNNTRMEIVGLVGDVKYMEIRDAMRPTVYEDVFQQASVPSQFLIRTERNPETVAAAVRAEVKSVMGDVTVREKTLQDQIDASIVRERLVSTLAAIFGGLALLLAVIGLYGVVSNSVARRTKEIGIRIALGIDSRSVISMVLREVFVLVGGGIVLGLPLAFLVTRSIASLLYGLAPDDPLTLLASVGALLLAALTAGFLPARRASRVDPLAALRIE